MKIRETINFLRIGRGDSDENKTVKCTESSCGFGRVRPSFRPEVIILPWVVVSSECEGHTGLGHPPSLMW